MWIVATTGAPLTTGQRAAACRRGVAEMDLSAGEGHRGQLDELLVVRVIDAAKSGHGAGEGADVVRRILAKIGPKSMLICPF